MSKRARNTVLLLGILVVSLALYVAAEGDSTTATAGLLALLGLLMAGTILSR